ncbi:MAG: nicotinate-nucleotide--dimethylbenzimidazole phosphoribosyltransferase [Clostridia bacterium]|jgi:nicotinate-nucleotide--dimethylbenzimidazole phosphoribosyltransferase|nr:nicotinate-nucleotide--dimethylbenzimidazole phosphoribosyltransferase [Clostridia bacterium]
MNLKTQDFDKKAQLYAENKWDSIAKPIHSLGKLENAISKMAGIFSSYNEIDIKKAALVIMCADHGVVCEGVTQTDSSITKLVTDNFQNADTSVTIMSKFSGVDIFPVDVGIDCENYENKELMPFKVCDRKIKKGTGDILIEPAMTYEECKRAISVGINTVGELAKKGYKIIATGEMGIGNTTPSSILCAAVLNKSAEEVTGKGAGLCEEGYINKISVVEKTIKRIIKNFTGDYLSLYADGGGLELAAMTGLFIGGAVFGVPVIIDGFISSVAALMAVKLCDKCIDYIFASHISNESASGLILDKLGLETYINCNMCLGEGTGAIAVIPLFQMAAEIYNKMSTFDEIHMKAYINYEKGACHD